MISMLDPIFTSDTHMLDAGLESKFLSLALGVGWLDSKLKKFFFGNHSFKPVRTATKRVS
jgi:hypothetical protein